MVTLVTGGSASGKSAYAEGLVLESPARPRVYAAAMEPFGEEARRRIERHRQLRAGKGFETWELPRAADYGTIPAGCAALVECVTPLGFDGAEDRIVAGVAAFCRRAADAVLVSGDLFTDGMTYPAETERYLQVLAGVNRRLAALADRVVEVCCGIPIVIKE